MVEEFASGAVKILSRRPFRRTARQTLVGRNRSAGHPQRGRFTETDLDSLLSGIWQRYDALSGRLPASLGSGRR